MFSVCIALKSYGIEITNKEFEKYISKVEPVDHRLSISQINNIYLIDDSYSSNVVGFKDAIDVLKSFDGIKTIITPGIVDAGKFEEELNLEITNSLLNDLDEICLIENKASKIIEDTLNKKNVTYQKFNNFTGAYLYLVNKYNGIDTKVYILIENDLPDSFLER